MPPTTPRRPEPNRLTISLDAYHLVGFGFRCSMSCLRAVSPGCAAEATVALASTLANHQLPASFNDTFLAWSLAVECDAARSIDVSPIAAPDLSRDERLAVALVAACQHGTCPGLRACAEALLGPCDSSRAMAATSQLASTLRGFDKVIADRYVLSAPASFDRPTPNPSKPSQMH